MYSPVAATVEGLPPGAVQRTSPVFSSTHAIPSRVLHSKYCVPSGPCQATAEFSLPLTFGCFQAMSPVCALRAVNSPASATARPSTTRNDECPLPDLLRQTSSPLCASRQNASP